MPDKAGQALRLLCPVILILLSAVDLTILVNCSAQIMLLVTDLDEDFVDIESVAIALVLSFQPA